MFPYCTVLGSAMLPAQPLLAPAVLEQSCCSPARQQSLMQGGRQRVSIYQSELSLSRNFKREWRGFGREKEKCPSGAKIAQSTLYCSCAAAQHREIST
jgi:hypothetical protein